MCRLVPNVFRKKFMRCIWEANRSVISVLLSSMNVLNACMKRINKTKDLLGFQLNSNGQLIITN